MSSMLTAGHPSRNDLKIVINDCMAAPLYLSSAVLLMQGSCHLHDLVLLKL